MLAAAGTRGALLASDPRERQCLLCDMPVLREEVGEDGDGASVLYGCTTRPGESLVSCDSREEWECRPQIMGGSHAELAAGSRVRARVTWR